MYIIHNALKNVLRNISRNILLGVIMLSIIATAVIALCINNTASGIIDDYKNRFQTEVTISPDTQKMMTMEQRPSFIPPITAQQHLAFADSEYIASYAISATLGAFGGGLKAVDEEAESGGGGNMMINNSAGSGGEEFIQPTFQLKGDLWADFNNGMREVTKGRMVENDNECLISKEFAELNNIEVGDSITVTSNLYINENRDVRYQDITMTVTGIYFDANDEYDTGGLFKNSFMNKRNEILTTMNTLVSQLKEGESGVQATANYYLKSPDMLEAFTAEVRTKGLDDIFAVSADEASYNRAVGPVEGLRDISITFMIVVLILGAIIVILLSSIAIRERKYEIGVLRAMGMEKWKVSLGLWSEMLIITCVCLVIGIAAGSVISQPVTDTMLSRQVEAANAAQQLASQGPRLMLIGVGGNSANSDITPLDELDVTLGIDTLLQITAISLLLASIAGIAAISHITKYEPIKILMERN